MDDLDQKNAMELRVILWDAINQYAIACGANADALPSGPRMDAVVVVERALDMLKTFHEARTSGYLESGVKGKQGLYPDWVYSARDAIQHRDQNIPWLNDLLDALQWNGGTIHDALNCVRRLVDASEDAAAMPDEDQRCES